MAYIVGYFVSSYFYVILSTSTVSSFVSGADIVGQQSTSSCFSFIFIELACRKILNVLLLVYFLLLSDVDI